MGPHPITERAIGGVLADDHHLLSVNVRLNDRQHVGMAAGFNPQPGLLLDGFYVNVLILRQLEGDFGSGDGGTLLGQPDYAEGSSP